MCCTELQWETQESGFITVLKMWGQLYWLRSDPLRFLFINSDSKHHSYDLSCHMCGVRTEGPSNSCRSMLGKKTTDCKFNCKYKNTGNSWWTIPLCWVSQSQRLSPFWMLYYTLCSWRLFLAGLYVLCCAHISSEKTQKQLITKK